MAPPFTISCVKVLHSGEKVIFVRKKMIVLEFVVELVGFQLRDDSRLLPLCPNYVDLVETLEKRVI